MAFQPFYLETAGTYFFSHVTDYCIYVFEVDQNSEKKTTTRMKSHS